MVRGLNCDVQVADTEADAGSSQVPTSRWDIIC